MAPLDWHGYFVCPVSADTLLSKSRAKTFTIESVHEDDFGQGRSAAGPRV